MEQNRLLLAELYTAYFNRAPDAAGLAYWVDELDRGAMTLGSIASNWVRFQPEFTQTYGANPDSDTLISQVYTNVLGRSPDSAGRTYWKTDLDSGVIAVDKFVLAIVNGAKASTGSANDAALLNNKAQVGVKVADSGINDIELAVKALEAVTSDTTTVDIVSDIVDMGKGDATALSQAIQTLMAVKELISAKVPSHANAHSSILENIKKMVNGVATKAAAGEVEDIASSLSAIKTSVRAAKTDDTFIQNPVAKANSIASNPAIAEEEAQSILDSDTTTDESLTPTEDNVNIDTNLSAEEFLIYDQLDMYDTNMWMKAHGWGNGGVFANGWDESKISFNEGVMHISLDSQSGSLLSGEYRTNEEYGYGYYETSLKASNTKGAINGFFTYTGPSEGMPHDEIDIEIKGDDTTKLQVNYWTNGIEHPTTIELGFDASQDFHTYGFLWSQDKIEWFVNGVLVHSEDGQRGALPTHEGKIMLNLWGSVGAGEWSSDYVASSQASLYVDYITYSEGAEVQNLTINELSVQNYQADIFIA